MPGRFPKYQVVRTSTGLRLAEDAYFVLVPEKDRAARIALAAYAEATEDQILAEDLRQWLQRLWSERTLYRGAIAGEHHRPERP